MRSRSSPATRFSTVSPARLLGHVCTCRTARWMAMANLASGSISVTAPRRSAALRHPEHRRGSLVLGEGDAALATDRQQSLGAVIAHAGEHYADARPTRRCRPPT